MANISITRRCRSHCRYCFARHEMNRDAATDMPPDTYAAALTFLRNAGVGEVRLLGGEPTEHPRFCTYVDQARQQGFGVVVFSGGRIPAPALAFMADLPADRFSVVLNSADPSEDPRSLIIRQREVCRILGAKITLGVNIRSPRQETAHLFQWMDEFGTSRRVRMGIAHPIWGGTNEFLRLRGPRAVPLFERIVAIGEARGVKVDFDCGFTPCMFSRDFMDAHANMFRRPIEENDAAGPHPEGCNDLGGRGALRSEMGTEALGMRCNPVVDILPEGDCIACYALSRFRRIPLSAGRGRDDLVRALADELWTVLPMGVHRECARCDYRAMGMCGGGCRARRALRLRPDASVPLEQVYT